VRNAPTSYLERLRDELTAIREDMDALLERSEIRYVNPNTRHSDFLFVGARGLGMGPERPGYHCHANGVPRRPSSGSSAALSATTAVNVTLKTTPRSRAS
jgi:hypothetical protein